uniref:Synuclein, alpha interacting protein n=1 Tax=Seriola lalandi dorsalis TaxID=1841481 RepID=A0A3B4YXQ8_SERLL
MEAPEYLDLDEIDFSDDSYSVTSLKSIPELSRRSDGPAEERPASPGSRQPGADQRRGQEQPAAHLGLSGSRRLSAAPHLSDGGGRPQRAQQPAAHPRRPGGQGVCVCVCVCVCLCVCVCVCTSLKSLKESLIK